jgi:glycosyltransferase involved in cell wall biosynthesis
VKTEAQMLGELTISVLQGEHGHQRKELEKLSDWLARDFRPEIINFTNVLLSGLAGEIKRRTGVPLIATLQGDDIYLEALPEPYRSRSLDLIRANCAVFDGFIATSAYYADFMAGYLGLPRDRIHVVHPGLDLAGHGVPRTSDNNGPPVIGYFARICPEKGLHVLVEAFRLVRQVHRAPCRLRVSGWLGDNNRAYFDDQCKRIDGWGLAGDFEHVPAPDHASKVAFLASLDVFSVPTVYREPKGLYLLEAWANRVAAVQPRHGSFPELIERTGGGILVNPEDSHDLALGLRQLVEDSQKRSELARKGQQAVQTDFHADRMAQDTIAVYRKYLAAPRR